MRSLHRLVLAVAPTLLLAACAGGGPTAHLTIRAQLKVCRAAHGCVLMPAAGARVKVVDSAGAVVANDTLTEAGTLATDVDPGDFHVAVSLLDLVRTGARVYVGDGEEVETTLNLPPLTASR